MQHNNMYHCSSYSAGGDSNEPWLWSLCPAADAYPSIPLVRRTAKWLQLLAAIQFYADNCGLDLTYTLEVLLDLVGKGIVEMRIDMNGAPEYLVAIWMQS